MTLKDIYSYVLGSPQKAILFVPKFIEGQEAAQMSAVVENAKTAEDNLRKLAAKQLTSFKELKTDAEKTANRAATQGAIGAANAHFHMMEVQYNPKSLDFRTIGGQTNSMSAGLGGEGENQIQQIDHQVETKLSCELVFTDVSIFNAFTIDAVGGGINFDSLKGLGAAYNKIKRKRYSVQPVVNGIISLLVQSYTRNVIFAWSDMVFRGELTRADANYKMFNNSGDPIIATINIEIRQGAESGMKYNDKYWTSQFEKVFKEVTT